MESSLTYFKRTLKSSLQRYSSSWH